MKKIILDKNTKLELMGVYDWNDIRYFDINPRIKEIIKSMSLVGNFQGKTYAGVKPGLVQLTLGYRDLYEYNPYVMQKSYISNIYLFNPDASYSVNKKDKFFEETADGITYYIRDLSSMMPQLEEKREENCGNFGKNIDNFMVLNINDYGALAEWPMIAYELYVKTPTDYYSLNIFAKYEAEENIDVELAKEKVKKYLGYKNLTRNS